jgi:hypothetical protein
VHLYWNSFASCSGSTANSGLNKDLTVGGCRVRGRGRGDVPGKWPRASYGAILFTCVIEGHLENPVEGRKKCRRYEEQNGIMEEGNHVSRISTRYEDHDNVDYAIQQLWKSHFPAILIIRN